MRNTVFSSPAYLPVPVSAEYPVKSSKLTMSASGTDLQALAPAVQPATLYEAWQMEKSLSGIFLLYGHSHVLRLSQKLACRILLQAESLLVLDGANVFDPYLVAELSRKAGREPKELLRRIRVSRSFTCHQMLSLIRQVEKAAKQWNNPLLVLLGPLTAFYDESVPSYEAWTLFRSFQKELDRLTQAGFRLLLACQQPAATTGRTFVKRLQSSARGVASCRRVEPTVGNTVSGLRVQVEKPIGADRGWLIQPEEMFRRRPYLP